MFAEPSAPGRCAGRRPTGWRSAPGFSTSPIGDLVAEVCSAPFTPTPAVPQRPPIGSLDGAGQPVLDVLAEPIVVNQFRRLRPPGAPLSVPLRHRRSILHRVVRVEAFRRISREMVDGERPRRRSAVVGMDDRAGGWCPAVDGMPRRWSPALRWVTISWELRRNAATRGGMVAYRAVAAQWHRDRRASRPKTAKLVENDRLREYVQDRLSVSMCGLRTCLTFRHQEMFHRSKWGGVSSAGCLCRGRRAG